MTDTGYPAPRCQFYERVKVKGGFRYDLINVSGPNGFDRFVTPHPPAVGDLISLWDAHRERGGVYRVVDRAWHHSSYGSTDWPYGSQAPKRGPLLDIVVEAAGGLFVDEVSDESGAQDG
ncbi:hypothetical protein ABT320_01600 [Streptomyces cellulosae]